eukprot:5607873-Prymnesium_polylepis.2
MSCLWIAPPMGSRSCPRRQVSASGCCAGQGRLCGVQALHPRPSMRECIIPPKSADAFTPPVLSYGPARSAH